MSNQIVAGAAEATARLADSAKRPFGLVEFREFGKGLALVRRFIVGRGVTPARELDAFALPLGLVCSRSQRPYQPDIVIDPYRKKNAQSFHSLSCSSRNSSSIRTLRSLALAAILDESRSNECKACGDSSYRAKIVILFLLPMCYCTTSRHSYCCMNHTFTALDRPDQAKPRCTPACLLTPIFGLYGILLHIQADCPYSDTSQSQAARDQALI